MNVSVNQGFEREALFGLQFSYFATKCVFAKEATRGHCVTQKIVGRYIQDFNQLDKYLHKIFSEDGTCSFENDMLIGLFSAGGRKNSAKGKWQIKDGILHITLFPEKTSEAAFSEIKLSANICVINAKSVSVYWTPETVKSCFELLKKAAAKKTSPDNKTFFTDKFTLWYGLDDHVYIELVKRSEIHVNYNEIKKTEQHIKTTSPTYIKK